VFKIIDIKECVPKTPCTTGKYRSTGSGIAIGTHNNGTLVLTAGHMCHQKLTPTFKKHLKSFSTYLQVLTVKNETFNVKVISSVYSGSDPRDVCLIFVDGVKLPTVKISRNGPRIGDKAYAMAAPGGIFHPPTVPLLSGIYSGPMPDRINDMYTVPSIGGSSGAGVLNSNMELVGIIYAAVKSFHHVTLSIGHHALVEFVKENTPAKSKKTK